jgi:hypothetical protein
VGKGRGLTARPGREKLAEAGGRFKRRGANALRRKDGGDEGIRTLGLCVANASLSHLSYIPTQKDILNHPLRISTVIFSREITTEAPAAAP